MDVMYSEWLLGSFVLAPKINDFLNLRRTFFGHLSASPPLLLHAQTVLVGQNFNHQSMSRTLWQSDGPTSFRNS